MYALPYISPTNEVCEGNVFTGVCLSTGGLGLCSAGSLSGEGVSVQGLGLCPGGVPVQEDAPKVKSGRYASYWNAFCVKYALTLHTLR